MEFITVQVVLLVCFAPLCCHGYSVAPPYSKCDAMFPLHPIVPGNFSTLNFGQRTPSPYTITVSKNNYSLGENLSVTIEGGEFKGFILQARSNDSSIPWPVGNFVSKPEKYSRYMFCPGSDYPQNTIGHVNKEKKSWTSRKFTWRAPTTVPVGDIHFWATVVRNYSVFWVKLRSDIVTGPAAVARPPPPNVTELEIIKTGCGTTRSCVSMPANCTDSSNCDYLLMYEVSGNNMTIEMSGKGQYVAVGFNNKPVMDKGDDLFCTVRGDGVFEGRVYINANHDAMREDNKVDFTLLEASYSNKTIKCRIIRKVKPQADNLKDLSTDRYLIFAKGQALSTGNVQFHDHWRWSTNSTVNIQIPAQHQPYYTIPTPPQPPLAITKEGCGKSKGCYSEPTECKDDSDCQYLVTYRKADDEHVEFEMSAKAKWVALGLNANKGGMAGIDAVVCAFIVNSVEYHHYDLDGEYLPSKSNLAGDDITLISSASEGNIVKCKFSRKITPQSSVLKNLNTSWYLVFGYGDVSGTALTQHDKNPKSSSAKVDLQVAVEITAEGLAKLVKAHGCVMSIAWLAFATIGIFMARYMKLVWEGELCKKKVWFVVHQSLMVSVVLLNIVGLILIFVHVENWSHSSVGAHPFVGIVTVGLAIIQPIMAMFRPAPDAEWRFLFNWAHRFVGLSAHILAVAALFLAVYIESLDLEDSGLYVLIAYCIGIGLVLLFEIYVSVHASASQGFSVTPTPTKKPPKVEQLEMQEKDSTGLSSSGKFLRKLVFVLVVLLSIGTGVALLVLVAII